MARSLFTDTSHLSRGMFALACLTLILGTVFHWHLVPYTQAQQPIKSAPVNSYTATANTVSSASDTFLALAKTVAEDAAAKRLVDYKLKNDPTSQPRYWAVVDFNQPSTSKRLYVFDTVEKKVNTYYVAHGRGSEGHNDDGVAETFSNTTGSNSSSLGIYKTLDVYNGHHGRSLRLEGLEPTNSNALSRAIVLHTADYVSDSFIRQTGRLGRSEGCFAVDKVVGDTLIDELGSGAYIVASRN